MGAALHFRLRALTVVTTIFLPLTFMTGVFGMNFGWMVKLLAFRCARHLCRSPDPFPLAAADRQRRIVAG